MITISSALALEWAAAWVEQEIAKAEHEAMQKVRQDFSGADADTLKEVEAQVRRLMAHAREIAQARTKKIIDAAERRAAA